jgi:hypothetical protein
MIRLINSITINVALFVLSFGLYTVLAFWMGFGSNDNYATHAWVLFYFFPFAQLVVFTVLVKRKRKLLSAYYLSGVLTILIAYGMVVYYYSR